MQEVGLVLLVLLLVLRTGSSQTIYPTGGLKTSKTRVQTNRSRTFFSIVKTGNASSLETATINSSSVTSSLENVKSGASTATLSPEKVSTRNTSSVDTFSAIQSNEIIPRKTEPGTPVSRTPALGNSASGTPASLVSGLGGQPSSSSSFVASSSGSTSHSFTGTAPNEAKANDIPLSSSFRYNSYVTNEATPSSFAKADSQNFSESPFLTLHNSTILGDSASSTPASGVAQELQSFFTLLGIVLGNSSRSMTAEFLPSLMKSGILLQNTLQKLSLVTQDLQPWPRCAADLAALHTGLQKGEPWALKMIDAMGKPQAGILLGEKTLVGQYDECRGISQKVNDGVIEGLFCTLQVKMDFSGRGGQLAAVTQVLSTVYVDICLPASCRDEADMLAGEIADTLGQRVEKTACVTSKDPTGDKLFWATIGIIAFLTLLGAWGTVYGIYLKRSEKREKINSRLRTPHFNSDINMAFNDETPANEKTPLQEVMVEDNNLSPTVTSSGLKSYVRSRD
ncbi:uncharacterized protein LOC112558312 [Pomacea canaliculata]|uniref:uncharacterized protein LOC112558312 n=1 Tax=Pomacea canaliculata TaxID=400727 RepID=UPI000D730F1F|nr:uncharacterized protein LOC112558312 [Pomacea canaliculata]